MKTNGKEKLIAGIIFILIFCIWTVLIQTVDVRPIGQNGSNVGLAAFNKWFHDLTGVNMLLYTVTDWLGLAAIFVCMIFGCIGVSQWIKRKSLLRVDRDIVLLGIYYIVVILGYLIFEMIPINYRPILIAGRMEASYPSSTTLLVLSVMPTLIMQTNRRLKNVRAKVIVDFPAISFILFMGIGRSVSGVHWITDIIGAVFLSFGLFYLYDAAVQMLCKD